MFFASGIGLERLFSPPAAFYAGCFAIALALLAYALYEGRVCGVVLSPLARALPLFLAVLAAGGLYCGARLAVADPLEALVGETAEVSGMVLSVQSRALAPLWQEKGAPAYDGTPNYHRIVLAPDGSSPVAGRRLLLQVSGENVDPSALVGAAVRVRGTVSLPTERRNPNCFDYRMYLKTMNIRAILSLDDDGLAPLAGDGGNPARALWGGLLNRLAVLKYSLIERVGESMGEDAAGVLAGMMFGDKSLMDDSLYESFQKNGTAHILSVSGIHVAIVYAFVIKLLGGGKGPLQSGTAAAALFFYAALAQFAPSVVRASLMILTHIISVLLRRRYDLLTGACAAAGAMLAINPLQLFHMGFQLSFLAIFSMAFAIPFADRYVAPTKEELAMAGRPRARADGSPDGSPDGGSRTAAENPALRRRMLSRNALRGALPLIAIQAGMAPYTAYAFNYFSAAAFLLNIPVIFLAGIIIPIGLGLMALMYVSETLFGIGSAAAEMLIDLMGALNSAAYSAEWGHRLVVSPPPALLALYYGLFFALSSETFRVFWQRRSRRRIAWTGVALACVVALAGAAPGLGWDRSALVFVDVGQGDSLHIRTPDGKNILIDGGGSVTRNVGKDVLLPYLLKNGVAKIDLALVTHLHTDHYRGVVELAQEMPVERLAVYEGNRPRQDEILRETGLDAEQIMYLRAGQRVALGKDVYVDVLFPEAPDAGAGDAAGDYAEEDENKSSLLMKLVYRGFSALMTGDLGFEGEAALTAAYRGREDALECSLLKVGHHGSRYSTDESFLDAISPDVAVIQVGKNSFGHPHPIALEKIGKRGIMVYRNDLSGAVLFSVSEDGRASVRTTIPPGGG
ncbi:MAG: ComEC/Rec2 family competence protein [Clostridiales Family XIII bacterium]|nr:ComEC/Rec2 family competence protein [Clostridiales Family XIII bacterium]